MKFQEGGPVALSSRSEKEMRGMAARSGRHRLRDRADRSGESDGATNESAGARIEEQAGKNLARGHNCFSFSIAFILSPIEQLFELIKVHCRRQRCTSRRRKWTAT